MEGRARRDTRGGRGSATPAGRFARALAAVAVALATCAASPCAAPRRDEADPGAGRVEIARGEGAPRIRAEVRWASPVALGGWGTLRVWGTPEEDALTLHALFDAPARTRRWAAPCDVRLRVDDRQVAMGARYVGRPIEGGVYDAVSVLFEVEEVRALASGVRVRGEVCGDPFELGPAQRATLRRFLERFDRVGAPRPGGRARPPEVGPSTVLPGEDDALGPAPA